jgi:hypothetical protein
MQPSIKENPIYNMEREALLTPNMSYRFKSARDASTFAAQRPVPQQQQWQNEAESLGDEPAQRAHGMDLPDPGNLFLDVADVILRDAPRHIQATAERCGIKSLQLTSASLEGVLSLTSSHALRDLIDLSIVQYSHASGMVLRALSKAASQV